MNSEILKPTVLTFASSAKAKSQIACSECKKSHRKCSILDGEAKCQRCTKLNFGCSLSKSTSNRSRLRENDLFASESVYAQVLQQNSNTRSQYITSSQPLAPILSKDSILCLDGEILGLFSPWRDVHYDKHHSQSIVDFDSIDPDLKFFLNKKRAFELPKKSTQLKLLKLFYENVYPLYPVINKNSNLEDIPLLLLNAIMLSAIRYSDEYDDNVEMIRVKANELKMRCKYLEMIESNTLTIIQSYLLISTHEEGAQGSTFSKEYASKAAILCIQLGIQVLGETNLEIEEDQDVEIFKLKYNKSLLLRIFWTSFCCDKYNSVTTSSAMIYNNSDLLIEEPTLKHFNNCEADFQIFSRWLSLCKLFERIICMTYRPPAKRSIDDSLERDLLEWDKRNDLENLNVEIKFKSFLKLVYYFCNILFLRCRIGVLNLIELTDFLDNPIVEYNGSPTPLSFSGMKYVQFFSAKILSLLDDQSYVHCEHILNIHSLLHVLVFIHLEIKVKDDAIMKTNELLKILRFKSDQLKHGLVLLKRFQIKWWLSGASYELFKVLISDENYCTSIDAFHNVYSQLTSNAMNAPNDQIA